MNRILVDASAAFDQQAGIGRYSRNILGRLLPLNPDAAWTLFHAPATRSDDDLLWQEPVPARRVTYPLSRRRFDRIGVRVGFPLPVRPFTGPQSLVYSPDFTAPPFHGAPRIVTVHDIAFLTHPHLTTPGMASYLTAGLEREIGRGAWFATVSETTRNRMMRELGMAEDRIEVIRNGVDGQFFVAKPLVTEERIRLRLPNEFLLMVGTVEPRKNHEGVLRAIRRRSDRGLPLVIVGRPGWGTGHLASQLAELESKGRVLWLRNLSDDLLPSIYASSKGVLYPSWTEGFGLPVLEALAAGRPVVTGSDSVFAEIGGSLVTQVDPADDDALSDAIRMLENDTGDEDRAAARRAHASIYNWDQPVAALDNWMRQLSTGEGR